MKNTVFGLLLISIMFIVHEAFAVQAVPWPVEKTQPDGTKITVYLRGDEKAHWMESLDGYSLMYDAQKFVVYAEQDSVGNMVPSAIRLGATGLRSSADYPPKGLRYSQSQRQALEQIWAATADASRLKAGITTGNREALCVLMGFSDRPFSKSKAEFETLFNQVGLYPVDGSAKGSVRDFFRENSYGKLDLTVTVVGPYTAPNTCAYYADVNHNREFAAAAAIAADAAVNYNEFADNGYLETFHILFAGYGDEAIGNGQQIWAHKWELETPLFLDNVRIGTYSCSPELRGNSGYNTTYIGVICHELSHIFGSPDYYDTDDNYFAGTGNWDLMGSGNWNDEGRQPGHINMFQKYLYGWVTPTYLTSFTEITNMPNSAEHAVAYFIAANNDNGECYVLENRQQTGFDGSLPGHGLLIWHVHRNTVLGYGSNAAHPQQLYPVVASSTTKIPTGTVASYGAINSAGTPFPGSTGKTGFTSATTPAIFTWQGLQTISKPITEITETGTTISFKFLDGPTAPVTNLKYELRGGELKLTWTAPANEAVLGYKIFRNGALEYTINNKATTTYTQIGLVNDTYEYCVSTFYEITESEKVCVSVPVTDGATDYLLPITDLQGNPSLNSVDLSWTPSFTGGWQTLASGDDLRWPFIGFPSLFLGTLWAPEHLRGLNGFQLTHVRFDNYDATASRRIQVWTVDRSGVRRKVYDQPYTETGIGIVTAPLSTPIVIDASLSYIVGVEFTSASPDPVFYFGGDRGPIAPGRNFLHSPGICDWTLIENIRGNNNLYMEINLSPGSPLSVQEYAVYRDGIQIGTTTSPAYTDKGLMPGTPYSYCVSAVYSGGASEYVCTSTATLTLENASKLTSLEVFPGIFEQEYDPDILTYTCKIYADEPALFVAAQASEGVTVTGTGKHLLSGSNNTIKVELVSSDRKVIKTYTIHIVRAGTKNLPVLTLCDNLIVSPKVVHAGQEVRVLSAFTGNLNEEEWKGEVCFVVFDSQHNFVGYYPERINVSAEPRMGWDLYTIRHFTFSTPGNYFVSAYCKPASENAWIKVSTTTFFGIAYHNDAHVVVVEPNRNAYLENLQVDWKLSAFFQPDVTDYTMTVDNTVTDINIVAKTAHPHATVRGDGSHTLPNGNSSIDITVTSPDKSHTVTYTLHIVRQDKANSAIMTLGNHLTASSNTIEIGQPFHVDFTVWNMGTTYWEGDYGIHIFDEQHNLIDIIEYGMILGFDPTWQYVLTIGINGVVLPTPGTYYLSLYYRSLGGNWIKVSNNEDHYPNFINELRITASAPPSDIKPVEATSLLVYPNPANDYFNITGLRSNGTVSIYDTSGKLWLTQNTATPEIYININNFPKGVYFIRIKEGINVTTKVLIKK
ncbi:MAG: M6 family metalloprotease domain-containing protein [Dysgonamonadaceae bacterium]|jgi:M6 family metalloprotease-like protein|nr:M6 family metalloprotease domain-containing protein [Dysgonamonadaceae bacterium]